MNYFLNSRGKREGKNCPTNCGIVASTALIGRSVQLAFVQNHATARKPTILTIFESVQNALDAGLNIVLENRAITVGIDTQALSAAVAPR
ncbi:MAG: hypothetical protein WB615_08340 [Candidatus Tumulicola sp.]